MLKNYLKTALRSLLKHKAYSFINIFGLSVGVASCIMISMYILYELSYDEFHEKSERIYRIAWHNENPQTRTPHPMAQAMVRDLPQVEAAVSLSPIWGPGLTRPTFAVRYGDKTFEEKGLLSVDTTFFEVFSFPFVAGDPRTALRHPESIVITERTARKYFGEEDPVGKMIRINGDTDFMVSAVIEDVPGNSHFTFDFLVSYPFLKTRDTGPYYTWADFGHYNYIVLHPDADPRALESHMMDWSDKYLNWTDGQKESFRNGTVSFRLQNITDIHLTSHLRWELEPNSHTTYIYILAAAALFILLIACVNFMNLTTARSMERAKEIGMRKTLGARRRDLIGQFIGEAMLYSFFGMVGAIFFVDLLSPLFGQISGKELPWHPLEWAPRLLGLMMVVTFLAGAYPALFLSGFDPLKILRGRFVHSLQGNRFRKTLVVFQFTVSIALVAGTFIAFQQLNHMRNADTGLEKEQIVVVPLRQDETRIRYKTVKAQLLANPNILSATGVSNVPGGNFNQNGIRWNEGEAQVNMSELSVDEDFFAVMGLEMKSGRSISDTYGADSAFSYVLNEVAARQFEWKEAVGESLTWLDERGDYEGRVVGVVEDFNFKSLHQPIGPLIFRMIPRSFGSMLIKVKTFGLEQSLAHIERTFLEFEPDRSFTYSFLADDFGKLYQAEARMSTLLAVFSLLAIFVACLGLFGLASFMAEKRTREIGIRKVLGASSGQIVLLLTGDLFRLVVLALLLATPVAWWAMAQWLEGFAFRISLTPWVFLGAGLLALATALLTISLKAFHAANANPITALRTE